jgi:hypothetical protein
MYEWREKDFHPQPAEDFIRCMGIFPIGPLVELSTGSIGVVITINRARRLKPKVALVLTASKTPYSHKVVTDLMEHPMARVRRSRSRASCPWDRTVSTPCTILFSCKRRPPDGGGSRSQARVRRLLSFTEMIDTVVDPPPPIPLPRGEGETPFSRYLGTGRQKSPPGGGGIGWGVSSIYVIFNKSSFALILIAGWIFFVPSIPGLIYWGAVLLLSSVSYNQEADSCGCLIAPIFPGFHRITPASRALPDQECAD